MPLVLKRITPERFQVPPAAVPVPSHSTCGGPPAAGMVLSFPSAKNPMNLLSGDQNQTRA
jgi:hypothetical protein